MTGVNQRVNCFLYRSVFAMFFFTRLKKKILNTIFEYFILCIRNLGEKFQVMDQRNTNNLEREESKIIISEIFMILGRDLIPVQEAPAGRICAIESETGWISGHVLCLLSSETDELLNFNDFKNLCFDSTSNVVEPLVRVTVQPETSSLDEMFELRSALKQLSILDGAVRVFEQENGDLALVTAGEVHLQKCLQVYCLCFFFK